MRFHYRNLTNGLLCPCSIDLTAGQPVVRIQSTACEQKRWGAILHDVGADLLYRLACGNTVVVHDKSERNRETRACWQGLSWIRYASHRAWAPDTPPPSEYARNGMLISPYWEQQWRKLPRSTRHYLRYYEKFYHGTFIDLQSCYMPPRPRAVALLLGELEYDV